MPRDWRRCFRCLAAVAQSARRNLRQHKPNSRVASGRVASDSWVNWRYLSDDRRLTAGCLAHQALPKSAHMFCREKRHALQYGLCAKDRLDAAIKELADLDRLRAQNEYKPATLAINPEPLDAILILPLTE